MKKEDVTLYMSSTKTAEIEKMKWSTSEKAMHVKIAKRIKEKAMDTFEYNYKGKTTKIDNLDTLAKFVKEVYKIDSETAADKRKQRETILSHKHSHALKCKGCGKYFDSMNKITYKGSNGLAAVSECPHCGVKKNVAMTDKAMDLVQGSDGIMRRAQPKVKMSKKARRRLKK